MATDRKQPVCRPTEGALVPAYLQFHAVSSYWASAAFLELILGCFYFRTGSITLFTAVTVSQSEYQRKVHRWAFCCKCDNCRYYSLFRFLSLVRVGVVSLPDWYTKKSIQAFIFLLQTKTVVPSSAWAYKSWRKMATSRVHISYHYDYELSQASHHLNHTPQVWSTGCLSCIRANWQFCCCFGDVWQCGIGFRAHY